MLGKFGLILVIVLFGAAMFLVGVLAPQSIRQPIADAAAALRESRAARQAAAPHATIPGPAQAEPAAIPFQDLLVPTPLPLDGTYAVQLGMYSTVDSAAAWVERVRASGLPVATIPVLDEHGARWIAVVTGRYNSPDDARAARLSLSRSLGLAQPLLVIRLPPPKPAPAT